MCLGMPDKQKPARKPFPTYLAGKRLLAGMGPHVPISVGGSQEPLFINVTFVVNHLKEK